ncbi:hypothetical protein [Caballeronia sp. BCC1704]|uniref:hypothetical protein n=1 Tax=Caballeronia sp. BCC1704 TaxID=2676300 RepID=UPI00158DA2F5|nr:hypothetical protein [Caballeronia sp. BCC1704]
MDEAIKAFSCEEVRELVQAHSAYTAPGAEPAKTPEEFAARELAEQVAWAYKKIESRAAADPNAPAGASAKLLREAKGFGFCFIDNRPATSTESARAEVWIIGTNPYPRKPREPVALPLGRANLDTLQGGFDQFCAEADRHAREGMARLLEIIDGDPMDQVFNAAPEEAAIYRELLAQAGFSGEGVARREAAELAEILAKAKREQAAEPAAQRDGSSARGKGRGL